MIFIGLLRAIVNDIKTLMAKDWTLSLQHTYREGDYLAKKGSRGDEDLVILDF